MVIENGPFPTLSLNSPLRHIWRHQFTKISILTTLTLLNNSVKASVSNNSHCHPSQKSPQELQTRRSILTSPTRSSWGKQDYELFKPGSWARATPGSTGIPRVMEAQGGMWKKTAQWSRGILLRVTSPFPCRTREQPVSHPDSGACPNAPALPTVWTQTRTHPFWLLAQAFW